MLCRLGYRNRTNIGLSPSTHMDAQLRVLGVELDGTEASFQSPCNTNFPRPTCELTTATSRAESIEDAL